MKTLKVKNLLLGLVAILAIAITMTSCEQDSLVTPIETQDEITERRRLACAPPNVSDFYYVEHSNRINIYAYDYDGINHEFQYNIDNSPFWFSLGQTTAYHNTINDIEPCTTYSIRLRVQCADGTWSNWSEGITFTTQGLCSGCLAPADTDIIITEQNCSLHLYAFPYQGVTHEFQYSLNGNTHTSLGVTTSHGSTITKKECGTYEIRLRVACPDGTWSEWTTKTHIVDECP